MCEISLFFSIEKVPNGEYSNWIPSAIFRLLLIIFHVPESPFILLFLSFPGYKKYSFYPVFS